jgi:hypothetical protein
LKTNAMIMLAAALILGSTSMSFAASRVQRSAHQAFTQPALQSREVALPRVAPVTSAEEAWMDRASQGYGF